MSYLFVAFVAFTLGCMFAHGSDRRCMRGLVDMNRHLQRELRSSQHECDVLRREYDRLRRN